MLNDCKSPETAEGDVIQTRSIATPDMRRPFEVYVCVCVCLCVCGTSTLSVISLD